MPCVMLQISLLSLLTLLQVSLPSLTVSVSLPTHSAPKRPVYGYIHMAKVAGSNLNAALSTHYERVCGNKGNSYDALQHNHRVNRTGAIHITASLNDLYSNPPDVVGFNRGRVKNRDLVEIGFLNCDYIFLENVYTQWFLLAMLYQRYAILLEVHVPCRDPIIHLMSQCNFLNIPFQCNRSLTEIKAVVENCLKYMHRFSSQLTRKVPNLSLRCFASNLTFSRYVPYMGRRLQSRKIQMVHSDRSTNRPRQRAAECIWDNEHAALRKEVAEYLIGELLLYCNVI